MSCYLSIVMAASNEGYGGNFLARMQNSLDSIFTGAARYGVDMEFILVDWGSPEDRALYKVIDWSKASIPVKIIQVSKEFINTIQNTLKQPFREPWAKSVGIRRSSGSFILTTNADSVYSSEVLKYLAKQQLNKEVFYRVNRHDMKDGKVFQIQRANGCFTPGEPFEGVSKTPAAYSSDMLHFNAAGEFILMSKEKYHEIRGWPELDYWCNVDGYVVWLAAQHGLKQEVLPYPIYHQDHPRGWADRWSPGWSDAEPYAIKNGEDWGFPNEAFHTIRLGGRHD